jgi:hypothetical protein
MRNLQKKWVLKQSRRQHNAGGETGGLETFGC